MTDIGKRSISEVQKKTWKDRKTKKSEVWVKKELHC